MQENLGIGESVAVQVERSQPSTNLVCLAIISLIIVIFIIVLMIYLIRKGRSKNEKENIVGDTINPSGGTISQ